MTTIVCSKDDNAPNENEWLVPISSLSNMVCPAERKNGLTWDGQFLWIGSCCDYDNDGFLYKINTSTLNVVESLNVGHNYADGIEYVNGYLWTSHNGSESIRKIDPSTGSMLFESAEMGAWIPGIAWDGQYLWCNSGNEQTIYKYDIQNNNVISEFYHDLGISDMTYVNGYFYIVANGNLHKCTMVPFHAEQSYSLNDVSLGGVTYDGNDFWVSTYNYNENPENRIQKITF